MSISPTLQSQRKFFRSHKTKSVDFRQQALKDLLAAMQKYENRIYEALKADLNKSRSEAFLCEYGMLLNELRHALKSLASWSKPRRVSAPLMHQPASAYVQPEPLGSVLIISPWNYPLLLCLSPLIAALSAGNCCVLKPSELAPATSALIKEMLESCFKPEYVCVVEGGVPETQELLAEQFDHIIYTGGGRVAKIVMRAAAEHLTPLTLELGGKSPCIVDKSANLPLAARRILFGKILNAGQTCIAPDYIFVHQDVKAELIAQLREQCTQMLGEAPLQNPSYPRIISRTHYQRVCGLMQQQNIVMGGQCCEESLQIEPTLIDSPDAQSPLMQEEIFGPLLPLLSYQSWDEVEDFVLARPKPLACYLFANDKAIQKAWQQNLSFGGGCLNDTIVHIGVPELPFGGVGASGMGSYLGKLGFDQLSHLKAVLKRSQWPDISTRYQPFSDAKDKILRFFMK